MIATAIGAAVSAFRLTRVTQAVPFETRLGLYRPWLSALALPFLVQGAVGSGQLGLGTLLAQSRPPAEAAIIAGLCLAAGYLALLAVHRLLTAQGTRIGPAAAILAMALLLPVLWPQPLPLVGATAVAAAASGLMIARHLARVMQSKPDLAHQNAAWQGSAQLAGLGAGAGAASLALPLGASAPFLMGGALALIVLLTCQRFP